MYAAMVKVSVVPRGVDGGRATIGIGINKNVAKVNNLKATNPLEVSLTHTYIYTYADAHVCMYMCAVQIASYNTTANTVKPKNVKIAFIHNTIHTALLCTYIKNE